MRYPRVAARWLSRFLEEHPDATIEDAGLAACCLIALPGSRHREAAQTLKTIQDIGDRLGELTLDAKQRLSEVAATDVPAAAVALQEAQNLLQYSYAVTSQVFNTSLLDYLA